MIRIVDLRLLDLSGDKGRFLQLKHAFFSYEDPMGFLPNGDLILVSLDDYKIYLYSFINKPTNATLWEYSQIYDIKFHKSLKTHKTKCFVHQEKLFFSNEGHLTQWDLSTMRLEMRYNLVIKDIYNIIINKNQTLLALLITYENNETFRIDIYSMTTGTHISSYG